MRITIDDILIAYTRYRIYFDDLLVNIQGFPVNFKELDSHQQHAAICDALGHPDGVEGFFEIKGHSGCPHDEEAQDFLSKYHCI